MKWMRSSVTGRSRSIIPCLVAVAILATGCSSEGRSSTKKPSTSRGTTPGAGAGAVVVTVAGDIASGSSDNARATGDLVRATNPAWALTLGDNAYPDGSDDDFRVRYEPTWGSFRTKTLPAPGNHEYHTPDAAGYFNYFFDGVRAGNEYRAYALGRGWRGYSLNCEIDCDTDSAQVSWLRADLAVHPDAHVIAYLHRPRYSSSSNHGSQDEVQPLWEVLETAGADLILGGHDHLYERFAPLSPTGAPTAAGQGIRSFVVGTGGAGLYGIGTLLPGSEVRMEQYGILRLRLFADRYEWAFLATDGTTHDVGQQATRQRPPKGS